MLAILFRAKIVHTEVPEDSKGQFVLKAYVELDGFNLGEKRHLDAIVWIPSYHQRRVQFIQDNKNKYVTFRCDWLFPVWKVDGKVKTIDAAFLMAEVDY